MNKISTKAKAVPQGVLPVRFSQPLRAAGLLWAIAIAGGCAVEGGGCGIGTVGVMGKVSFDFDQVWLEDVSAESGRAFAVDTYARFSITDLTDEGLGPYTVVSSDENIMTVRPQEPREGDPELGRWRAEFRAVGTVKLEVRSTADQRLLDWVTLRVAQPASLALTVGPGRLSLWEGGIDEPERVVVYRGGLFHLYARVLDAHGDVLLGSFSPRIQPTGLSAEIVPGMMTSLAPLDDRVYAETAILVREAGDGSLEITGPGGVTRQMPVSVSDSAANVGSLETFFLGGEPLEVREGRWMTFVAVGHQAPRVPAFGFPVDFSSSNESVAEIMPSGEPDWCVVRFVAPGTVEITARLRENPSVQTSVSVRVVPREATTGEHPPAD